MLFYENKHEQFFLFLLLVGVLLSIFVTVFTARLTTNPKTANVSHAGAASFYCDADGDGLVTDHDRGTFYNYYFNREKNADVNRDGVINVLDQERFENCFK